MKQSVFQNYKNRFDSISDYFLEKTAVDHVLKTIRTSEHKISIEKIQKKLSLSLIETIRAIAYLRNELGYIKQPSNTHTAWDNP